MRVLLVHPGPHYSVSDVYYGWAKGLAAAGVGVARFNLDERLDFYSASYVAMQDGEMRKACDPEMSARLACNGIKAAAFDWWPQVVIVVSGMFVPPDIIDAINGRGMHTVLLATEAPYEDNRHMMQAAKFDTVIVNDPVNLEAFREINPDTHYIPHAFDPAVHHPGDDERSGVCFVGTAFPSRIELFEEVDWSGLDFSLAGHWKNIADDSSLHKYLITSTDDCYENSDTADLYRRSAAGFNCYRQEHQEGKHDHAAGVACGPREIEMAACGLPFVRDARPESDELFPFLPTYESAEQLGDQLRWLVSDKDRAAVLGGRARAAVARRTFAHNAASFLRIINQ